MKAEELGALQADLDRTTTSIFSSLTGPAFCQSPNAMLGCPGHANMIDS